MPEAKQQIIASVGEFFLLAGLMAAVPLVVSIDASVFRHGTPELGVTELTQAGLILMSAALFAVVARRRPASRGLAALIAGFFGCMFIRECDAHLDHVAPGFWFYPAVGLAATAIIFAMRCPGGFASPAAAFVATRPYVFILIGLLVVVVFSRVFGTSRLWRGLMGAGYDPHFKDIIQEGVELMGYVLIAYGAVLESCRREVAAPSRVDAMVLSTASGAASGPARPGPIRRPRAPAESRPASRSASSAGHARTGE